MGFPDRIERIVHLDRPPAEVWSALTTADGLSAWFSDEVAIELRPGGAARMTWSATHAPVMRVERVEPHRVFAFTWPISGVDDTGPRTYVEFTLEPVDGGTRLTLVESGFAQLPDDTHGPTYDGHLKGWVRELDKLVAYLLGYAVTSPAARRRAVDLEGIAEQVFVALADPSRRAVLAALAADGPATVTELAGRLPITRQAIAKHLALLAAAGLVTAESGERRRVRYRLRSAPMQVAQQFLAALARDWDTRLDNLKRLVDRPQNQKGT